MPTPNDFAAYLEALSDRLPVNAQADEIFRAAMSHYLNKVRALALSDAPVEIRRGAVAAYDLELIATLNTMEETERRT